MAAQLHSLAVKRAQNAPELVELSPARHRLRQCIAAVDHARREAERAAEPVNRLSEVIGEHERLQRQLNELYLRDEAATGEWVAGGRVGLDPGEKAADTRATNDRIIGMRAEVQGARRVIADKEKAHRSAVEQLQAAQRERDGAVYATAVECAGDLAGELTGALNRALAIEAKIRSVRDALVVRSDAGDTAAAGAASRLIAVILAARQAAGVPGDNVSGRVLLEALAMDPGATLT
jgi:hypothetical protein